MRATDLAHLLLAPVLKPGAWAVDATVGNGHDTLWLAQSVGPTGRVFGFDVQPVALAATAARLKDHPHVSLIPAGHEALALHLPPQAKGQLCAVMFNLGYLPGADHAITTRTHTTLAALSAALGWLRIGGRVTLVLYPGHPGGAEESAAVTAFAKALPPTFAATHITRLNARHAAPELLMIERLGS